MRAALAVNLVLPDAEANLAAILRMAHEAADAGADLALFPEAALTGLINNDDPEHDLPLGQTIPGPATESLGRVARVRRIWLAAGLLERAGNTLYDSAVLLAPDGGLALTYRRMDSHWHGRDAEPAVYRQGTEPAKTDTPFGSLAFLICGDLFSDEIAERARALAPDWLLVPYARCFSDGSRDQARWDRDEMPQYAERVRRLGVTTLMASYLAGDGLERDGDAFGGAMAIAADGTVLDTLPLGKVGILLAEL